jgi:signal transduction histidine kinase
MTMMREALSTLLFLIALTLSARGEIPFDHLSQEPDSAYLPLKVEMTGSDVGALSRRPVEHSIRVVKEGIRGKSEASYFVAVNPTVAQDLPAQFALCRWPGRDLINERPLKFTVSDVAFTPDSSGRTINVYGTGFRNDSAHFFMFQTPDGPLSTRFVATGNDQTGDGKWQGVFRHLLTSDIDGDSHLELLFYLNSDRDLTPRSLFCVDATNLAIKWSLPVAAPVTKLYNCAASGDGGVLFITGNPGQSARDSLFSDDEGYLVRVDRAGRILFHRKISQYPVAADLIPMSTPGRFTLLRHRHEQIGSMSLDSTYLSVINESGVEQKTFSDSGRADILWLGQYGSETTPCLFVFYLNHDLKLFTEDLDLRRVFPATYLHYYNGSIPRFDGQFPAYAFSLDNGTVGLFNSSLEQVANIPFSPDYFQVLERSADGSVVAIAASNTAGEYRMITFQKRGMRDFVAIFYRKNQPYILAGFFTLMVGLLFSLVFGRKLSVSNARLQLAHQQLLATQAQLVESSVREASHRAHRDLIGSIAHRIRNSMSLADLNAQTIKRRYGHELPDGAKEMLNQIGESLKMTSENIAAFAAYERIEQEILDEPVEVPAVLEQVAASFRPALEDRRINLKVDCSPHLTIWGTRRHIHLIFENLLKNGIEAIKGSGSIRIVAEAIDGHLQLSYEDTGPGIPADLLSQLGKRIVSTKPTTGLGIGVLSIFEVFKAYGGKVQYFNSPEGGVKVVGRMPLRRMFGK